MWDVFPGSKVLHSRRMFCVADRPACVDSHVEVVKLIELQWLSLAPMSQRDCRQQAVDVPSLTIFCVEIQRRHQAGYYLTIFQHEVIALADLDCRWVQVPPALGSSRSPRKKPNMRIRNFSASSSCEARISISCVNGSSYRSACRTFRIGIWSQPSLTCPVDTMSAVIFRQSAVHRIEILLSETSNDFGRKPNCIVKPSGASSTEACPV